MALRTQSLNDPNAQREVYWRSRRGMLELELKLVPFVRDCYSGLPAPEQAAYRDLLELEDWQIFDWLQAREAPRDADTRALIDKIIRHQGRL